MLGKAIHASTAIYDQSVLDGTGITISEAAATAVDTLQHPDEEVNWWDENRAEGEKIALELHTKYCTIIAPTQTYAAVEILCDRLEITDLGIALTGTTDRIREVDGQYGIADIKSGKLAVGRDGKAKIQGHGAQLGAYEILAEYGSGLIIGAPSQIIGLTTAKTDKGQRIGTGIIEGARELLLGDGETKGALEHASDIIHSGNFYGNSRSVLCDKKFCPIYGGCKWRF